MIILSNIGKSAITFQFKKHIKEKLSVSSKQFPQSVKISADSVRMSTPFLMSGCAVPQRWAPECVTRRKWQEVFFTIFIFAFMSIGQVEGLAYADPVPR